MHETLEWFTSYNGFRPHTALGNLSTEVWLQKQPKTSTRKWCSFGEQVIPAQMYFYVLKGIRNIEYFYTRTSFHPGGPHKVVKDVDVNGD